VQHRDAAAGRAARAGATTTESGTCGLGFKDRFIRQHLIYVMRTPYLHAQGGAAADVEGEEEEEGDQRLAIQMDVSVDTGTCNICATKVRTGVNVERVKP